MLNNIMRSLLGLQDDQQVDLNVKPSLDISMLNDIFLLHTKT